VPTATRTLVADAGPPPRPTPNARPQRLLLGGALAGPLFVTDFLLNGLTEAGYDPLRHPSARWLSGPTAGYRPSTSSRPACSTWAWGWAWPGPPTDDGRRPTHRGHDRLPRRGRPDRGRPLPHRPGERLPARYARPAHRLLDPRRTARRPIDPDLRRHPDRRTDLRGVERPAAAPGMGCGQRRLRRPRPAGHGRAGTGAGSPHSPCERAGGLTPPLDGDRRPVTEVPPSREDVRSGSPGRIVIGRW